MAHVLILIVMLFVIASLLTSASALAGPKDGEYDWKGAPTTPNASWSN
jgi:hypothetical protein